MIFVAEIQVLRPLRNLVLGSYDDEAMIFVNINIMNLNGWQKTISCSLVQTVRKRWWEK